MKTSTLGNVRVMTADRKPHDHNFGRNIYTSCGFGEVQPCSMYDCQQPGSHNLKNEFLCYLADINVPTYGHVDVHFWHYFVNIEDLFEVYPRLMAQTKSFNGQISNGLYNAGYDKSVPVQLPSIPHNLLSCLLLIGAHCTVYKVDVASGDNRILKYTGYEQNNTTQNTAAAAWFNTFKTDADNYLSDKVGQAGMVAIDTTNANIRKKFGIDLASWCIDVRALIDCPTISNVPKSMYIPLSNNSLSDASWTELLTSNGFPLEVDDNGVDCAPVSIDGADFIIERNFATTAHPNGGRYIFAFRMHSFGNRLFKVFKGLEFQEDFTKFVPESIAPFLAYYKAYWNSFGLELYQNWDTTPAGIICRAYDNNYSELLDFSAFLMLDDSSVSGNSWSAAKEDTFACCYLTSFFMDLGSTWYTDAQDYVSAQQRSVTVAPTVDQSFIDGAVPLSPNNSAGVTVPTSDGTEVDTETQFGKNGHSYISLLQHGQLSAEVLQILYRQTNIETLAGKRIKELLLAQGFGKWMDSQKCSFIGHDVESVEFSQVISTADTDFTGMAPGALVGSRGGRGQAYKDCKPHSYHNDKPGYLITMCAVVPDSGYTQKMNTAFECLKKYDFYQRDFDGKGFEATKIKYINAERPVKFLDSSTGAEIANDTERTFGFAPRMSKFKQVGNILSGHFAKRSERASFLPYNMDRVLHVGEVVTKLDDTFTSGGVGQRQVECSCVFPITEMPLAGNHWRYPTRYPWLGMYTRIFALVGDDYQRFNSIIASYAMLRNAWEFFNNEEDGFSLMITLSEHQKNPMLQLADSYETTDDSNEGSTNHNMSKA